MNGEAALKWGVPYSAKGENVGYKLNNARAETIEEKPAFKRLLERKRGLIPADGFSNGCRAQMVKSSTAVQAIEFEAIGINNIEHRRMECPGAN